VGSYLSNLQSDYIDELMTFNSKVHHLSVTVHSKTDSLDCVYGMTSAAKVVSIIWRIQHCIAVKPQHTGTSKSLVWLGCRGL
jgi:hypothetical protein